jgi:hypothetical protein
LIDAEGINIRFAPINIPLCGAARQLLLSRETGKPRQLNKGVKTQRGKTVNPDLLAMLTTQEYTDWKLHHSRRDCCPICRDRICQTYYDFFLEAE